MRTSKLRKLVLVCVLSYCTAAMAHERIVYECRHHQQRRFQDTPCPEVTEQICHHYAVTPILRRREHERPWQRQRLARRQWLQDMARMLNKLDPDTIILQVPLGLTQE